MQPDTPQNNSSSGNDDRKVVVPPARSDAPTSTPSRDAAASMVRDQIDRLYDSQADIARENYAEHAQIPAAAVAQPGGESVQVGGPYRRTHSDESIALGMASQSEAWEKYHSAWQKYYQQYYQRYYLQQLDASRQKLTPQPVHIKTEEKPRWLESDESTKIGIYSDEATKDTTVASSKKSDVANELKSKLLSTVTSKAKKVRSSHHFMPIVSALSVGLLFLGLQFNQLIQGQVRAYISPGSINPQNIIVDPNATATVGPEPKLIIPKLNVDAPIVYDVGSLQDGPVQEALKRGVVHYPLPGADSRPGQVGNNVILGHSSNDVFDDGQYKFVFTLLERLEVGDTFFINHESKRYTYSVTKKEVIRPSEVGKLIYQTDKPVVSLVTCVPVGTAANRLIVTAEQISPDPSSAIAAPNQPTTTSQTANIPGNAPTIFERLFGQ